MLDWAKFQLLMHAEGNHTIWEHWKNILFYPTSLQSSTDVTSIIFIS